METATLFKLLSHPQRLAILRRLMSGQATLTQLGEYFHETPAHIRHHLKILEQGGLIEFAEAHTVQGGPEKYYRAAERTLFIQQAILPEIPAGKLALTVGSIDSAVRRLAVQFSQTGAPVYMLHLPLSSLDSLIALRQGQCQISASHLIDPQSQEYNRSHVRHLFPGQSMALVRIFHRDEGLIVAPGNPLGVRALEDLARPDIRFVNREAGSGVRQWLDNALKNLGIAPESVHGYDTIARSHNAVARHVQQGRADLGIGLAASARELGMDFIPLYEEPYELVMPHSLLLNPAYTSFFDYLNSGAFSLSFSDLPGYSLPQSPAVEVIQ